MPESGPGTTHRGDSGSLFECVYQDEYVTAYHGDAMVLIYVLAFPETRTRYELLRERMGL